MKYLYSLKLKILFIVLMVALIVLDFAAMDDITTGNDPSHILEYLTLLASVPLFSILGCMFVGTNNVPELADITAL